MGKHSTPSIITIAAVIILAIVFYLFRQGTADLADITPFINASENINHVSIRTAYESLGGGVCVLDANGDGKDDIFIAGNGKPNIKEEGIDNYFLMMLDNGPMILLDYKLELVTDSFDLPSSLAFNSRTHEEVIKEVDFYETISTSWFPTTIAW